MATTYFTPGVYIEEVPSARQPIAGVGTNTVGFIGIVPDRIYCAIPNDGYDPAKAADTAAPDPEDAAKAARDKEEADRVVRDKQKAFDDAKLEKGKLPVEPDAEKKKALDKAADDKIAAAKHELDDATAAQKTLADKINKKKAAADAAKARAAAAAAMPKDSDDKAYEPVEPDVALLQQVPERPYYLKPFEVKPKPFDTKLCTNFTEYANRFGDFSAFGTDGRPLSLGHHLLTHAVAGFFKNGGTRCFVARVKSASEDDMRRVFAEFESIDEIAIIAAPGLPKKTAVWEDLELYCEDPNHQNVFAILDSPADIDDKNGDPDYETLTYTDEPGRSVLPRKSNHAAIYFPHVQVMDPAKQLQEQDPARGVGSKYRGLTYVPPSGHMAGIYARIDNERGVHKAPANTVVRGALEVKYYVSKSKQAGLNPQGVNCIRLMDNAAVVWGARTMGGEKNGEWKYINVRRFAGFLEESIDEGTQWVVFEPNDPTLWSKIRLNITDFLTNVWRNGALFGLTPAEAFYVKCDAELNPAEVRELGWVVTEIGVAIVRPAEFVIFRITQSTGAQNA